MSLFLIFSISNAKANDIHYNYTFESVDLNLEPKFNRTSNLRPKQEFHEGVFDAEFSFTDLKDTNIDDLDFFDVVYKDSYCNGIIQDLENHKDVLKITDYNLSGYLNALHSFGAFNESVISFWINSIDVSTSFSFNIESENVSRVKLAFNNNLFFYQNLVDTWIVIADSDIVDNVWYHLKIVSNCSSDTFDFNLDGRLIGNDLEFNKVSDSLDCLSFDTEVVSINTVYLDAIDIIEGIIYNHSNVEILKTDTNQYQVDKWAFHQDDIDTRGPKSGGIGGDEYGWQVSGNVIRASGTFRNPETGVIDSENIYMRFDSNVEVTNIYMLRYFGVQYTNSEMELYFEFSPNQFPNPSVFGMYITDLATNTILSIIIQNVGAGYIYKISNGIDSIVPFEFFMNDKIYVRVVYNTEYKVFNIHTHRIVGANTFDYYDIFESTIGNDFYGIKFNVYSGSTIETNVKLDNIGIYVNGSSLNEDMFGYAEILYDSLESLESSLLFEGYSHVGTTYPNNFLSGYIIDDDDLDTLYNLGYNKESLDLGLCKDSLIFTLDAYTHTFETIELIGFQDNVRLLENNDTYYKGTIERGSDISIYSKYDVVNSRLEGYLESEGLTNEWISIEFDIDDFLTTNYSFIINDMYKTNWLFNTVFTMSFTDGTQFVYSMVSSNPFEITGNQFVSDFGTQLSKYKYIDTFKFNISGTIESEGTNILSGINSMKLHCNSLGFIDLDDLHDSGILAIMIPLILLIFPTFVISSIAESKREGSGKKIFIPFFLIMATILFASAIIPTWIYFIIVLGFGALLILKKRLSHD